MSYTSIKVRELFELIEGLHSDAASISGDIDNLHNEVIEKQREMAEIKRIAIEKLAELESALEDDFEDEQMGRDDYEKEAFYVEDDDDYRTAEGMLVEIEAWSDAANE